MSRKPDCSVQSIPRTDGNVDAPLQQSGDALDEVGLVERVVQLHEQSLRSSCRASEPLAPAAGWRAPLIGARSPILVLTCAPGGLPTVATAELRLVTSPTLDNGWRSEVVASGASGRRILAEVVAAPAGLTDRETSLAGSGPSGGPAKRTRALRDLGVADRRRCAAIRMEPLRVLPAEPGTHCEDDGTVRLAGLVALFRDVEQLVPAGGRHAPEPHLRRFHIFSDVVPGSLLAVSTLLSKGVPPAPSSLARRSFVRRLGDGEVVAFSETVLR